MTHFFTRNKYNAKPSVYEGISFSSKAELEFYQLLKADKNTIHVDAHVPVTLPGGIRFNIDFIVYKKLDCENENSGQVEAIEVKGFETQVFSRMRKLFDETHPLAPLRVFRKSGNRWESI